MTSSPPPDIPEFRGKTLTPVSPRPVHLPEPSNVPVLENQMDPLFNETSTHLGPSAGLEPQADVDDGQSGLLPETHPYPISYPGSGSNGAGEGVRGNGVQADAEVNDDYAMSLDLDDETWDATIAPTNGLEANHSTAVQPPDTSALLNTDPLLPSATLPDGPPFTTTTTATTTIEQSTIPTDPAQSLDGPEASTTASAEAIDAATLIAEAAKLHQDDAQAQAQAQSAKEESSDFTNGGVDIQALLDNLSPPIATDPSPEEIIPPTGNSPGVSSDVLKPGNAASPSSGLPAHPNLPPRPPRQEKPVVQPRYPPQDDIRSYHPHNQTPVGAPGFGLQHAPSFRPPQGQPPAVLAVGAPGTATSLPASSLPPPPLATFQQSSVASVQQQQSPITPSIQQREKADGNASKRGGSVEEDDEIPWGPEIQKIYDEFLHEERVYVTEGQWDRFPPNSRLFIGNLPTEKVTKRDLFYVFQKHGRLAQVSIKQAYGFIQFLDADACYRALQAEQGQSVRGRKMHLEISKPQKNTRNAGGDSAGGRSALNRRSRSPDYIRGGNSPRGQNFGGRGGDRVDRGVDNRSGRQGRDRGFAERRMRDDYRPARSPSPRGYRGADDYRRTRDRSRDRYDGGALRSRSRSPYRRGSRYHSRSPPPRWDAEEEADMLLPKRLPRDVPEVQFLLIDELDRNFVSFVEKAFRDRGIRTDVLMLDPRLPLAVVIRRQILEGVQAVVRLTRQSQMSVKIPLQVFDRTSGADNVRFDEYDNLDANIAAELVIRARQTHGGGNPVAAAAAAAPPPNQFGAPPQGYQASQYGQMFAPPIQQAPAIPGGLNAAAGPNLANLITSLDGPGLQKLLGALQQQQPQTTPHQQLPTQAAGLPADLASLLGGAGAVAAAAAAARQQPAQQQLSAYGQPAAQPQPTTNPYATAAFAGNPALASLLASAAVTNRAGQQTQQSGSSQMQMSSMQAHPPLPPPPPTAHVQNIMEQLAKWKQ